MILCTASIGDKVEALSKWIESHVTPFPSDHWNPLGLFDVHLPSYLPVQALMMILVTLVILILFGVLYNKKSLAPQGFIAKFFEPFILFIRNDIVSSNLGKEGADKWTPLFCTLFFFILGCNLMGLIPGNATATGSFITTGGLALITFFLMTLGTIVKYGPVKFLKAFVPEGVPFPLLFLLVPLEMVGVFIKCIALTIRLFANMFAGHIVLFAIMGLVYVFGWFALPALGVSVAVFALEVFVAFLQTYIFTFFSAMFIGEMFHHAHGHDESPAH